MREITIRGWIKLPSRQLFDNAIAVVGLDDVTQIDSSSKRVAETIIERICGWQDSIPFSLEAHWDFQSRNSYVLATEIRCSGEKGLRPGDFLTTVAVPWTVSETDGKLVPVSRI